MMQKAPRGLASKLLRYALVLTAVCVVSGAGLSLLFVKTHDLIIEKELEAFEAQLALVMGEAGDVQPFGDYPDGTSPEEKLYVGSVAAGRRYAARGAARGYQSTIVVLVSVDELGSDPVIHRVAVVSSSETPGLGENIKEVETDVSLWGAIAGKGGKGGTPRRRFLDRFSNRPLSEVKVDKTGGVGIEPVTGATRSSRAVAEAVRDAVQRIMDKVEQ